MISDENAAEFSGADEPSNVLALEELRDELSAMQSAIDIMAAFVIDGSMPVDKIRSAQTLVDSAKHCTREYSGLVQTAQAFEQVDQLGDAEVATIEDKATALFCTAQYIRSQLTAMQKYARRGSKTILPYLGPKSTAIH